MSSMSVGSSTSGLSALYATTSSSATSASAPAQSISNAVDGIPEDDTITDQKTLTTKIAQEQLAYLTQMQSAFQASLLSTGIVDSTTAPLIFGTGNTSVLALLNQSATSTSDDPDDAGGLIITPGLSNLGASVLSGKTALQDLVDAGTKNAQASHQADTGYIAPPPPTQDQIDALP